MVLLMTDPREPSAPQSNSQPTPTLTTDDGVVVRPAAGTHTGALTDLHRRCSAETLYDRYHTGLHALPPRWAAALLAPAHGCAFVAEKDSALVGYGQLIATVHEPGLAEASLLVEDAWQHRGVGAALLSSACTAARSRGITQLFGRSLGSRRGFERTARHLGLAVSTHSEPGVTIVDVKVP